MKKLIYKETIEEFDENSRLIKRTTVENYEEIEDEKCESSDSSAYECLNSKQNIVLGEKKAMYRKNNTGDCVYTEKGRTTNGD